MQNLETSGKGKQESFVVKLFAYYKGGLNFSGLKSTLLVDLKKSSRNSTREM